MTPDPGATISGTARTVTMGDIVAALGERMPDVANAQKQFKVGFVLLTRPGTAAGTASAAVETLRSAWAGKFAELTGGKGSAQGVAPSLAVNIDTPTDGATITGPDTTVTGTIINSTGAETGVTVNGIPAMVSGSKFIVNHLPLQEGSNTLTITATDANGLTGTTTRNVTAQAGHYLRISSNVNSGTGPLEVSFRINGSFSVAIYTTSASGPVPVTIIPGQSPDEFSARLVVEGMYTVTVSATAPDGQAYSDSVTVTVVNKNQLDSLLKAKWEGMKSKVIAGDIPGAGTYFPVASRDMFLSLFADASIDIVARLNDVTAVKVYSISGYYAYGGLMRQDLDGLFSYPVTFSMDEFGLWRIYNF
jgi:hypothetical protein